VKTAPVTQRPHSPGPLGDGPSRTAASDGGYDSTILDWLDELTATCAKKRVNDMRDQCGVRCPDLPKVV
jgi:hypothetical protein